MSAARRSSLGAHTATLTPSPGLSALTQAETEAVVSRPADRTMWHQATGKPLTAPAASPARSQNVRR
jgi:hypothetical protein